MRLPFHAFRFPPVATDCASLPQCFQHALDVPPFVSVPVYDLIDIPTGFDLVATDGFYLLLFVVFLRLTLQAARS